MVARDVAGRLREAGRRESEAWRALGSRAEWEAYAAARVGRMRTALNVPDDVRERKAPTLTVTRTVTGDGWFADATAYESRPGLVVTANLYRPAAPPPSMPGILISHSHHAPRTEGELRDMGVGWARAGCVVLIPDHLGHGERRAHPFASTDSFPKSFRVARQDYYFRYNTSLQLYAAGETLMGWMAHDLSRGVDVLLAHKGVDPARIALLGAVAGGGDPAAVAAALDPRITAVAPFNFGGPQPETRYPLPADAESSFDYTGGGSWESTRNLYRSATDGFLPWVIVGSVAPRTLVYGHEFDWDQERDPVWRRLVTIWGWYGAPDRLGWARGRGSVKGKAPESTHCTNIGPEHRRRVAAWLKRSANISEPVEGGPRPAVDDLRVNAAAAGVPMPPLHEVIARVAEDRQRAAASRLADLAPTQRRDAARKVWAAVLGDVEPPKAAIPDEVLESAAGGPPWARHRILRTERDVVVPVTLLSPGGFDGRRPAVVMFARAGKQKLLAARSAEVARMLDAGWDVCLADLRGFGETAVGTSRGRTGEATAISASHLMLGDPLVAAQLRDLRCVLRHLRACDFVDPGRIALWGDSLTPASPAGVTAAVPLDADQPAPAEPAAALVALLGGLFEDVAAVHARGGLAAYRDLLRSPFVHVPHDGVVPGVIAAGDVPALLAAVAPTPVLSTGTVDAWNRPAGPPERPEPDAVAWLIDRVRRR